MPYVEVQSEFGRNKGESLTFTRFDHIAEVDDAEVAETDPLPEVAFSISTSQFVIKEYGVAVPYTEKIEALAHFNVENLVQRTLMEQKRLVLDTLALKSFLLTNVKYVPTGAATKSVTYNGTPSGTAQEALTYFHVEDISALMFDTLNVPYWEGDVYMGIFRAKTLTTLRRDSQFTAWNQYGNAGVKAKGEVGIIERLKLLETNHAKPLPYVGSNNFGQGIVFGKDAVGMIEALAPELRAALPSGHGRFKSIAWFGRLGFNIIFSGLTTQAASIGKARVIHVTSA
jgi:N4-gp56 family major capsid protein